MIFPATTAVYAALLAILYVVLAARVVARRGSTNVMEGSNGDDVLEKRVRSHANFGEYVPLALILIALLEGGGGNHVLVQVLLLVLLVARLLHPFGIVAPLNSPQQYICRGGGIGGTLLVIAVAAVALLVLVA